ncbi:MAG: leucyl aminopeptidase [Notoacmeibacter sp.]|nr:leucyl aminopeptidase [Notoacmeibacter sp.]MCC0033114.1 leucyl aminopeptidase [Brucellaceae bacterium]
MTERPAISFAKFSTPKKGNAILLAGAEGALSEHARALDPEGVVARAASAADFKAKLAAAMDVLAPAGIGYGKLSVVGAGEADKRDSNAWLRIGGAVCGACAKDGETSVVASLPDGDVAPEDAAALAMGMILRAYRFDKYKTKGDKPSKPGKVTILCADPAAAKKAFAEAEAIADGVVLARDLVNEPANILGPVEFAAKAKELEKLGVEVEILTEKEMKKLGMGALLGVAQGSVRPPRLAVMQWKGGKAKDKPVAFIGKGVVFDTGGISIKPSAGMEDMKGDMGGAAAVTGLMHALAARKAKANVVGIIGLVENMPDGNAQRPGDIVTSMSGQTIEVLNTDAEGRLVLCDALHYCNDRFKPRFMVNLATLTGAILVALGQEHAGLFSNDDELAGRLFTAGQDTGEKLWRMPMAPEYDKMIDSKNADMKNIGGRFAGAITAAQFLKRFVGDTPWAHLDVAGTAMGSPATDISKGWASGFGVRLLDRLVRDHYEG